MKYHKSLAVENLYFRMKKGKSLEDASRLIASSDVIYDEDIATVEDRSILNDQPAISSGVVEVARQEAPTVIPRGSSTPPAPDRTTERAPDGYERSDRDTDPAPRNTFGYDGDFFSS